MNPKLQSLYGLKFHPFRPDVPTEALYWCDGKRNLAEVIRLTELEMGPQSFDFVGYFKFLEKHGYVEFTRN